MVEEASLKAGYQSKSQVMGRRKSGKNLEEEHSRRNEECEGPKEKQKQSTAEYFRENERNSNRELEQLPDC